MEAEPSNPPEVYKNAAGFAPPVVTTTVSAGGRTYVNLDSKNWQGGTTTVVTPSSAAPLFADLQSHTMMEERKLNRGGGRKSASLKDEEEYDASVTISQPQGAGRGAWTRRRPCR